MGKMKIKADKMLRPLALLSVSSILLMSFLLLVAVVPDTSDACFAQCASLCTTYVKPPGQCAPGNPYGCICPPSPPPPPPPPPSSLVQPGVPSCPGYSGFPPSEQECADQGRYYLGETVDVNGCYVRPQCGDLLPPPPPVNQPVVAQLLIDPSFGSAPIQVSFDITCQDPDGIVESCVLDFGDPTFPAVFDVGSGSNLIQQTIGFIYLTQTEGSYQDEFGGTLGSYQAELTAQDNGGSIAVTTVLITVQPPEETEPGGQIDFGSAEGVTIGFICPTTANTHDACVQALTKNCALPEGCSALCPTDSCTPPSYCLINPELNCPVPDLCPPDSCSPPLGCKQALGCPLPNSCTPAQCPPAPGCLAEPTCKLTTTTNTVVVDLQPKDICSPCTINEECASGICSEDVSGQCNEDGKVCIECTSNDQCSSNLCDLTTNRCDSCTSDSQCSASTNNCNLGTGICESCTDSFQCEETGLCNTGAGTCIECGSDAMCTSTGFNYPCVEPGVDEITGFQLPGPNKCQECSVDSECTFGFCGIGGECSSCTDSAFACAENEVCISETGLCEPTGCETYADCELGRVCKPSSDGTLKCQLCNDNSECLDPDNPICNEAGLCVSELQCEPPTIFNPQTGNCEGTCLLILIPTPDCPDPGVLVSRGEDNNGCSLGFDCKEIECSEELSCPDGLICTNNVCKSPVCETDADCIDSVVGNTCREGICIHVTQECTLDSNCPPNNICQNNKCVQQIIVDPKPPIIRGGGGGTSSVSAVIPPVSFVRNVVNEAAIPLIYSLFNVSRIKTESAQECIRGASCTTSADCCGATCFAGSCTASTTACSTSADCLTGYCEGGNCRLPPETSLFLDRAASRGFNAQIGCAGLIQECDASEKNCISVCNGLTFLLALTAGGAGSFVWKRYKHPVPGFAAALVPLIVGLSTYPFVGIIIGIMLFSILLSRR